MDRHLLLRVHGGLGNRLRAMLSGQMWAEQAGRRLRIAWAVDDTFGASPHDLFRTEYRAVPVTAVKVAARVCGGYHTVEDLRLDDPRRRIVAETSDTFLDSTGNRLPWERLLRTIEPVPEVASRVKAMGQWNVPTIGVMIRAHQDASTGTHRLSPPEWFYGRMAEIRQTDPSTPFFLSTDSPDVSVEVHRRFDNVVELRDKSPHNSRGGVQDALTDLYLLAGTTYIIGSSGSSFSTTACLLAGHDAYETTTNRPPQTWPARRSIITRPALTSA